MTPKFKYEMEKRFMDYMTPQYGTTVPLYFSNDDVPAGVYTYAVLHVMASENVIPINLGQYAKSRNAGVLQIDVFTPKDTGSVRGATIAVFAASIFNRQTIGVPDEGTAVMKDGAVQDRGEVLGLHKQMVSVGYRYDFTLAQVS